MITNAATGNTNVKALVYVDAFIPAAGEVVSQLITDPSSCLAVPDLSTVLDFVPFPGAPAGVFDAYVEAEPLPRLLRERPRSCARRGPRGDPATLVDGCLRRTVWRSGVGDHLVVGRGRDHDHVIPKSDQLAMANRAHAHITKVDAPHLSMISSPSAVVRVMRRGGPGLIDRTS